MFCIHYTYLYIFITTGWLCCDGPNFKKSWDIINNGNYEWCYHTHDWGCFSHPAKWTDYRNQPLYGNIQGCKYRANPGRVTYSKSNDKANWLNIKKSEAIFELYLLMFKTKTTYLLTLSEICEVVHVHWMCWKREAAQIKEYT